MEVTNWLSPRRHSCRLFGAQDALSGRRLVARGGKRDGLTVDRRPGSLVQKMARSRREFYEDRDARLSILAGALNWHANQLPCRSRR